MSLRYALLALLTAQPMTGYDLARAFHTSVGHVWHAPDSQIYPELRRMQADGLLRADEVTWGQRGVKTQYTITEVGRRRPPPLDDRAPRVHPPTRQCPPACRLPGVDGSADRPGATRARTPSTSANSGSSGRASSSRSGIALTRSSPAGWRPLPESEWRRITAFKEFTYEGLIAQADQEIAWAERGQRLIDELSTSDTARWD